MQGSMATPSTPSGLDPVCTNGVQQADDWWRPWSGHRRQPSAQPSSCGDGADGKLSKTPQVIHPVKLFWPKSRCFDYLYQDAERLLRTYPVQATISPYQDSSSDEDSDDDDDDDDDDDEEEAVDKELN